jgi:excinuclease UvrABC helicase subunit UvrB
VAAIDRGLDEIRAMLAGRGEAERFDQANEVQLLRGMREMLVPKLPTSQRSELEERMRAAIRAENYELAAILRDELRQLP